jgi:hypothetical protein
MGHHIIRKKRKHYWKVCGWSETVMKPLLTTITPSPLSESLSVCCGGGLVPLVGLGLLTISSIIEILRNISKLLTNPLESLIL